MGKKIKIADLAKFSENSVLSKIWLNNRGFLGSRQESNVHNLHIANATTNSEYPNFFEGKQYVQILHILATEQPSGFYGQFGFQPANHFQPVTRLKKNPKALIFNHLLHIAEILNTC